MTTSYVRQVEARSLVDIQGAIADPRREGGRIAIRLLDDVVLTETLEFDKSSVSLDLNGFSLIAAEAADPAISFYNNIPVSDAGAMTFTNPGETGGPVQDVQVSNGFIFVAGESVFRLDGSRIQISKLHIGGGEKLFVDSTQATRSFSQLSCCTWTPSSATAFDMPSGMRTDNLIVTSPHGAITLKSKSSLSNCQLSGEVSLEGDGASVTGCNMGGGLLDFTPHIVSARNASSNVDTGASSGASAEPQDIYEGNN